MSDFLTLNGRIVNKKHITSIRIRKKPAAGSRKLGDKGGVQLIPDSPAARADPDIRFIENGFELIINFMYDEAIQIHKDTADEVNSIFNEFEEILGSKKIKYKD